MRVLKNVLTFFSTMYRIFADTKFKKIEFYNYWLLYCSKQIHWFNEKTSEKIKKVLLDLSYIRNAITYFEIEEKEERKLNTKDKMSKYIIAIVSSLLGALSGALLTYFLKTLQRKKRNAVK